MKTGIKLLSLPEPFLPLNRASLSHSTTAEGGGDTTRGKILWQIFTAIFVSKIESHQIHIRLFCNKDFLKSLHDQISKHMFLNKLLTVEN